MFFSYLDLAYCSTKRYACSANLDHCTPCLGSGVLLPLIGIAEILIFGAIQNNKQIFIATLNILQCNTAVV